MIAECIKAWPFKESVWFVTDLGHL
jgi:hypothetical protein